MNVERRNALQVKVGDYVTVQYEVVNGDHVSRGHGQGGTIKSLSHDPFHVVLVAPNGVEREFGGTVDANGVDDNGRRVAYFEVEVPMPAEECLDYGDGGCRGPVDWHSIDPGRSRAYPRCEHHWHKRLRRRQGSIEMYADSDVAPSWFDPTFAGESWDGE